MKIVTGIGLLAFMMSFSTLTASAFAADETGDRGARRIDSVCLNWDVKTDQNVNKLQSKRLYLEAARWVESRFGIVMKVRPCITVHVGESCPAHDNATACVSPVTGDLYLPSWSEYSAAQIAQATVMTAMLQLLDSGEVRKMAVTLLAEDRNDFLDAPASRRTGRK